MVKLGAEMRTRNFFFLKTSDHRSVMAGSAQHPPIQLVDLDVSTQLPDLSVPVNSIMEANSGDTRVVEHNQTEKVDFPNLTVLSMKETAEGSGTLETIISPMET